MGQRVDKAYSFRSIANVAERGGLVLTACFSFCLKEKIPWDERQGVKAPCFFVGKKCFWAHGRAALGSAALRFFTAQEQAR
jgi:hypothetical protein